MKRVLALLTLGLSCALAHAQATIERMSLYNALTPTQIWTTDPVTTEWILGVGDQPAGPILNAPDSSITGLPQGAYWLFANPGTLGSFARLVVRLSDGRSLSALFRVQGVNGSGRAWHRIRGSSLLSLGWAEGVIDLVGETNGVTPDGIPDLYIAATLGAPSAR